MNHPTANIKYNRLNEGQVPNNNQTINNPYHTQQQIPSTATTVTYYYNNNLNNTNTMPEQGGGYNANALPSGAQYVGNPGAGQMPMGQPMGTQAQYSQHSNNPYGQPMGQPIQTMASQPYAPVNNVGSMYDPATGVSNQNIQVTVSMPNQNNGQSYTGPMPGVLPPDVAAQRAQSQRNTGSSKKKEDDGCCRKCLTPTFIIYVILYLSMGICYMVAIMQRLWWLVMVAFVVILIQDFVMVKIRDKHNEMCDCSSDPIEEGRVKACMAMLIFTLFMIIFGSVYYANDADLIWGYITGGLYVIVFLFGMYAASEPGKSYK